MALVGPVLPTPIKAGVEAVREAAAAPQERIRGQAPATQRRPAAMVAMGLAVLAAVVAPLLAQATQARMAVAVAVLQNRKTPLAARAAQAPIGMRLMVLAGAVAGPDRHRRAAKVVCMAAVEAAA